jgi:hypothetical protein
MMKVALINKNPAVSRLITLSLNKIGTEYSEFEDLNGFDDAQFDFIIIDSDVDSSELATTKDVMYLASRGESKPEFATLMLEKPFLPTEFISVFEQNMSKDEPVAEHGASEQGESDFGDFSDEAINFDEMSGFKLPDIDTNLENFADLDKELSEGVSDDLEMDTDVSMPEIKSDEGLLDSLEELDELKELVSEDLADESVDEETSEAISDVHESEEGKDGDLVELSSLVDEIENMPEESETDEELNKNLDDIISQNDVVGLVDEEKVDGELDEIDQSKFELSEIESLDEALNSEVTEENSDELAQVDDENLEAKPEEELNDEVLAGSEDLNLDEELNLDEVPKDEVSENLDEISLEDEILEENIEEETAELSQIDEVSELEDLVLSGATTEEEPKAEENLELQDEILDEEAKFEENLEPVDEVLDEEAAQEEPENLVAADELNFDATSIDEIDENTMLAAFGLKDMPKTSSKNETKEDYKEELTKKITKHVHESLNESSLRDVLKDMNIKINISFEEK